MRPTSSSHANAPRLTGSKTNSTDLKVAKGRVTPKGHDETYGRGGI